MVAKHVWQGRHLQGLYVMDENSNHAPHPHRAAASSPPASSSLAYNFGNAWYCDCFVREFSAPGFDDALSAYYEMTRSAPWWVNRLLALRDSMIKWLGMTPTRGFGSCSKSAEELSVGDTLDFFEIVHLELGTLLLTLRDRHFDVKIEVHLLQQPHGQSVFVSSAVIPHSRVGKAYLYLIAPFHRVVVRSMLNSSL
jgi:hypothetical protein